MGVAALICGGKELSAVEPEQAKEKLNSQDQYCYSYDNKLTSAPKLAAPANGGPAKPLSAAHCEFTTWRTKAGSHNEGRRRANNSREALQVNSTSIIACTAEEIANKYETKGLLGKGKYSQVLQVQDRSTQTQYALKIVQKVPVLELEGNSYQVEVDILRQCRHPNIVSLHSVLHSVERVYLFLELALGGDMFDQLAARGRFSEARAKSVLRMVVEGVAYLHDNGITHRDLKLENLLFKSQRDDSPVLIADFGLAHVASKNGCDSKRSHNIGKGSCHMSRTCAEYMSTTCGTAEYMSPEMLEGEEYTNKVDMWAVGVVTYMALSGNMPFVERPERGGRAKMYHDIKRAVFTFSDHVWCDVTESALAFIQQLLCVDQDSRLSAAQALNHPWLVELSGGHS